MFNSVAGLCSRFLEAGLGCKNYQTSLFQSLAVVSYLRIEPAIPNLPNWNFQTEPPKPNLPNWTSQTKPPKPNLPNWTSHIYLVLARHSFVVIISLLPYTL